MGERKGSLLSCPIPALGTLETRASAVETSGPGGTRAGLGDFNKPPQMPGYTFSSHCLIPTTAGDTGLNLSLEGSPISHPAQIQALVLQLMEKCEPTSAEVGVAAGAEDAEESGLQGVAGVIAGDISKFLGKNKE